MRILRAAIIMTLLPLNSLADTEGGHPVADIQRQAEIIFNTALFGCEISNVGHALTLPEVVSLALCSQVDTRKAWAEIAAKNAERGLAQSEYWPTLNATVGVGLSRDKTEVPGEPFEDSDVSTKGYGGELDLSWKLFDFGTTRQKNRSARFAVLAALASKDSAVQTVTLNASQAYYDVLDAGAELAANQQAEAYALESVNSTANRFAAGIVVLTDKLQAQTAYSSARIKRITAEGDLRNSIGTLCVTIGLDADVAIEIHPDESVPNTDIVASIGELIAEAKSNNPDLEMSRARTEAAYADLAASRVEDFPSVSIVGSLNPQYEKPDRANFLVGSALPPNNVTYNRSLQLRVTVPLISGFSRRYKIREARARADQALVALQDSTRQVTLSVWKAYQSLRTETENYAATSELIANAEESYKAAKGRYIAGVGTVLDLLNAQSAVASANTQRIEALSQWRDAKLKLAASLGRLVQ